jgi:hypothetical protein
LSGVWQSLQPTTVTRYFPRSTRAAFGCAACADAVTDTCESAHPAARAAASIATAVKHFVFVIPISFKWLTVAQGFSLA